MLRNVVHAILGAIALGTATPAGGVSVTDQLTLHVDVQDAATRTPCLLIDIANRTRETVRIPYRMYTWGAFTVYLTRDGHALSNETEGLRKAASVGNLVRPHVISPSQPERLTDYGASDAHHVSCIPLSRWGYRDLSSGSYRLRVVPTYITENFPGSDIDDNRGLRSNIVSFTIP